jgi:hypothetical protein
MKTRWQFQFANWVGGSTHGVRLYGFRRNGRGKWLKVEEVPEEVREWFSLEKLPGAANDWVCPLFKNVTEFKEKAHHCQFQRSGSRLLVKGIVEVEIPPERRDIPTLECMNTHCDGSHCGLEDWYPEIEAGILAALRLGKDAVWTTGWYGSKKEIASAKITHLDRKIFCEASVSDDFDTEGIGEEIIPHTINLEKIRSAINKAWDQALSNQKDNRMYVGFSILHKTRVHGVYHGGKPADKGRISLAWVETLILPTGESETWDSPPGDN